MRKMKSFNFLFVFLIVLMMALPAAAGRKKFSVCLNVDETKTLIKYGGMEIEARCISVRPHDIIESHIDFISTVPNTRTTAGFFSDPFKIGMFGFRTHNTCDNGDNDGAMLSEKGHYLSIAGGTLIMCNQIGMCDCSFSGIIQKEKIRLK